MNYAASGGIICRLILQNKSNHCKLLIKIIPLSAVTFHEVDAEYAGQRLDNFLIRLLKGVPKSRIYRLIAKRRGSGQ